MIPEPNPPSDESACGIDNRTENGTEDGTENAADLSMLIKVLGDADRRLDELTAGEVDTVTDRQGRSFLLRRAQERLRQTGADKQAAILDALPALVVMLDAQGVVLTTNRSWREFADTNGLAQPAYGVGQNYLEMCDAVRGADAGEAAQVAAGIRSVLSGAEKSFTFEYACPLNEDTYWFLLTVNPVEEQRPRGAVVMHLDITARKRSEDEVRRFAAAMDATEDGILLIDRADMRFVHVNQSICRMSRMEREQVLALMPWEILGGTRGALEDLYDALIVGGGFSNPTEHFWNRKNGTAIWIEVRRHAHNLGGRWTIVILVRDFTARKAAESRIAYLNRVYAVLSGINTLIVRVRNRDELFRETCRIAVEQGALAMTWIGMVDRALDKVELVASEGMGNEFLSVVTQRLASNSVSSPGNSLPTRVVKERTAFVSNDSQRDAQVNFNEMHTRFGVRSIAIIPLMVADDAVGVIVLYARERDFFHDEQMKLLTELAGDVAFAVDHIEKQERLDYLAYYDVLTGLANRTLFIERLSQHLRSVAHVGRKLAVCMIDLERFKNINDSLGRPSGDALLRQVAQWLVKEVGDASLVARIEADRFAIVMAMIEDEEEVARVLEKTLQAFHNQSFRINDSEYRVAAKVGVALFPDDGSDEDLLFRNAEAALKKAKVVGDRYLFYAQRMTETVVGRLLLENQLRRALDLDEYVLHYQPKIDLSSGKLVGAEALIRWNDPLTGMVPPNRFVHILEETGLIHDVGRWALGKAMEDYLRWRRAGLPVVRLAVNISALQLRHRDFVSEIQRIIHVDPDVAEGLELEITETLIMDDVKLSIANLKAIRSMGVRIAIDDFGTGFSSLSYLSKLPIDTMKVDRSFVMDMLSGPEGISLVSTIVNLAHSLRLKVVAEGVETPEQLQQLIQLHCDEVQGYVVSKPLPAAEFEERFLTHFKGYEGISAANHNAAGILGGSISAQ